MSSAVNPVVSSGGRGRGRGRRGRGARRGASRGASRGAASRGRGRGRGRGSSRGRGRGRGVRGRGRGSFSRGRARSRAVAGAPTAVNFPQDESQPFNPFEDVGEDVEMKYKEDNGAEEKKSEIAEAVDGAASAVSALSSKNMRALLMSEAKILEHVAAYRQDPGLYVQELHTIVERKMLPSLSTPMKGRILATLFAHKEMLAVSFLLSLPQFGVAEMLKCMQVMDAPRRVRQLQRKWTRLTGLAPPGADHNPGDENTKDASQVTNHVEASKDSTVTTPSKSGSKVLPRTLAQLKMDLHNFASEFTDKSLVEGLGDLNEAKTSSSSSSSSRPPVEPMSVDETKGDELVLSNKRKLKLSVSGAVSKRVRRWASTIPAEKLEFSLLFFPSDPWKALADMVHFKPSDFAVPYFLTVSHGGAAPPDSFYTAGQMISKHTVETLLEKFPQLCSQYAFVRRKLHEEQQGLPNAFSTKVQEMMKFGFTQQACEVAIGRLPLSPIPDAVNWLITHPDELKVPRHIDGLMSDQAKEIFASRSPLQDVLWNWDELDCPTSRAAVSSRLVKCEVLGANSRVNYGKLMERLLYMRQRHMPFADLLIPYAQQKLKEIAVPRADDLRVAVFGDASGSMDVAVKCSTTLGSLLSVALNAQLSFFNGELFHPSVQPKTVEEVLRVVEETEADGSTSMAAALLPYYVDKIPLDLIVLCSDEEDNTDCANGMQFPALFQAYRDQVAPNCKVVLVSFLQVGDDGHLMTCLASLGIPCRQVRLDGNRPDTSKFDAVLGHVTLETTELKERLDVIRNTLLKNGIGQDPIQIVLTY